jgi:hypothetical protein
VSKSGIIVFCTFLSVLFCVSSAMADHASASFETGASGAIMTVPGRTLTQGKIVFGIGVQLIEFDELSDAELEAAGAADEDVHSTGSLLSVSANLVYGVTDDLTLGLSLPYVERRDVREAHHDMGMGEAELAGDANGVGDLRGFGQYRFYHGRAGDAAVIAGIKMPTGRTGERELEGGLFEAEQQPGSGSLGPFLGIAWNKGWGRTGLSANVLYTFTGEGTQQTDLDDIFNYNLALSYRLFSPAGGHDHHVHAHGLGIVDYVDAVLELNGDHRGNAEINGVEEENTGGHTLYLSPGVRIGLAHRWSIFASLGIPVVNDLNGLQGEPDYRVIGGVTFAF